MRYRGVIVILCGMILSFSAYSERPADKEIAVLPDETAALDVYARAKGSHWALLWDYVSDSSYVIADIVRLTPGLENGDYDYESAVTVSIVENGLARRVTEGRVRHKGLRAGLRLVKYDDFVVLTGGDGMRVGSVSDIPCRTPSGSKIVLRSFGDFSGPVTDVRFQKRIPLHNAPFDSADDIRGYLAQSVDSVEGLWEYMDREMMNDAVALGGYYRLATVRDGSGNYSIILVDGVRMYESLWQPMAIRGILRPTIFPNNFDLEWTDGQRLKVFSDETWASLELGGAVLKLNFPLLKSSLRFRRVPVK